MPTSEWNAEEGGAASSQRATDPAPAPAGQQEEPDTPPACTLLLPKVLLLRHGQSLFNAHYKAHAQVNNNGQATSASNSSPAAAASDSDSASAAAAAANSWLPCGSLVGGLALRRDRKPLNDPRLVDAPLTPLGQQQARAAAVQLRSRHGGPLDLILSTPLTRAIQTALLAFRPRHNCVDWSSAHLPSLDQPVHSDNVSVADPIDPVAERLAPIRVLHYHVEHLCASCDVGLPLSVLESRFAAEPHLDFATARSLTSDCWWHGASVGQNVAHLIIKRPAPGGPPPASAGAAAAAASSSSAAAAASAAAIPASRARITLKRSDSLPAGGIAIAREQSAHIEARTRQLLLYLLTLALEHSNDPDKSHRPMHVALVGHCGFFARLSGHTLDNCEIVELDWSTVLKRASIKGFLSLPSDMKASDVADVTKQHRIVRHWMQELTGGAAAATTQAAGASADARAPAPFTASNPPISSNTAHLYPPAGAGSHGSQ